MINLQKFGKIIASKRLEKNMTQSELAKILFITPQAVSKWERGECFPDIETLVLLCYEYNINIDFILNTCFEDLNLIDDISVDNIERYLQSSHRKGVINKFINGELDPLKIDALFYLLNTQERRMFIEKVISYELQIDFAEFIVLLSPAERMKFLDGLKANKEDIIEVAHLLSHLELRKYKLKRIDSKKGGYYYENS